MEIPALGPQHIALEKAKAKAKTRARVATCGTANGEKAASAPNGQRICFNFNKVSGCKKQRCVFAHVCQRCFGKHSFQQCKYKGSKSPTEVEAEP